MKIECVPVSFTAFFGGMAVGLAAMFIDAYGGPSLQKAFDVGDSPLGSLVIGFGFGAATILVLAGLARVIQRCSVVKVEEVRVVNVV